MAKWDVQVSQPFSCDAAEAQQRVDGMLAEFKQKNAAIVKDIRWNADKTEATADGKGFNGLFRVADGRVEGNVKLGLALRMMKGRVDDGLRKALAKTFG